MSIRTHIVALALAASALSSQVAAFTVQVDLDQSGSTFTYTLFNDEPVASPNYISTFHLTVDAPIVVSATPAGWEFETDNATYVDWYNTDFEPPYPHDIAPQASQIFSIQSSVTTTELLPYAASAWDHTTDEAGPFDQGLVLAPVFIQHPGDYSRNGVVDAADYVVWRHTLNDTGPDLPADGNTDGDVDAEDYDFWRARFGEMNGAGSAAMPAATVPEPISAVMLVIGTLPILCRRRPIAS